MAENPKFHPIAAAEITDLAGVLDGLLDRMRPVIATDLIWKIELVQARLKQIAERPPVAYPGAS